MTEITTIGLDIAKQIFHVHGADRDGRPVTRRKLRRNQVRDFFASLPPCLVAMEACGGAHHWGRCFRDLGHEVRLIPPQFVKPFVKTNKNDASDAEAISEAVLRPTMRFANLKSEDQQSILILHRVREMLVRQRTMLMNALRGHCTEFGIIVAQGPAHVSKLVDLVLDEGDESLPDLARQALRPLVDQLAGLKAELKALEKKLNAWHRTNAASLRLAAMPGVGVITATALVATLGDARQFKSGRQMAAFLGLVPNQHTTGGKNRLGRISKRGDGYLRRLLVHGARAVLRWSRQSKGGRTRWQQDLLARRPTNVVLVAMANKTARIAWALLSRETCYRADFKPVKPVAA